MKFDKLFSNGLGTKVLSGLLIAVTTGSISVGYNALQTLTRVETQIQNLQQSAEYRAKVRERRFDSLSRRIERLEDDND